MASTLLVVLNHGSTDINAPRAWRWALNCRVEQVIHYFSRHHVPLKRAAMRLPHR